MNLTHLNEENTELSEKYVTESPIAQVYNLCVQSTSTIWQALTMFKVMHANFDNNARLHGRVITPQAAKKYTPYTQYDRIVIPKSILLSQADGDSIIQTDDDSFTTPFTGLIKKCHANKFATYFLVRL